MKVNDPYIAAMKLLPAREWLQSNKNGYPLASNRLGNAASALSFVERLYGAGAAAVFIADPMDEPSRIELEGGPYSDTVVVVMPTDPAMRSRLFEIFAEEAENQGFEAPQDVEQTEHVLWWD